MERRGEGRTAEEKKGKKLKGGPGIESPWWAGGRIHGDRKRRRTRSAEKTRGEGLSRGSIR